MTEADLELGLQIRPTGSGDACRRVLTALPHWFGIPESVEGYVRAAEDNPTVVATARGRVVGVLTIVIHTPYAAEIYVMGVLPEHHRHGIGGAMLQEAESWLAARDIEFLQVKTLSPRRADSGYSRTRAFYVAQGFKQLEEFPDLWNPENPALQLIKIIDRT